MGFNPESYGFVAMYEGTTEGGDRQFAQAKITYLGPWAKRKDFLKNALGYRTFTGNIQHGYIITTVPPYAYPEDKRLYAQSYSIKPAGPPIGDPNIAGDQVKYQSCFIELNFSILAYAVEASEFGPNTDVYLKEDYEVGVEVLSVPQSAFKFKADSKRPDSSIDIKFPTIEYSITRFLMPFVPLYQNLQCVAKVNSLPFRGFLPGTLLYLGMSAEEGDRDINGNRTFEIQYKFSFKEQGWNALIRPDTYVFGEIVGSDGVTNPVGSTDFSVLLQ